MTLKRLNEVRRTWTTVRVASLTLRAGVDEDEIVSTARRNGIPVTERSGDLWIARILPRTRAKGIDHG